MGHHRCTVEVIARNWDNGGEGIAFHWPWGEGKAGNADTTIRPEDNMSITVWPADGFEQLSGLKSPDNTEIILLGLDIRKCATSWRIRSQGILHCRRK